MKRLSQYRSSPLFVINIVYNGEKISFSLAKELRIDEDTINDDLAKQPGHYGFCLLLHKKLLTAFEQAKLNRKKVWAKLYFEAKERNLNGRPYSDDAAKAWVDKHKDYLAASKECIAIKDNADTIYSCIKSFEQKKDLMQSMSSNIRSQK